MSMVDLLLYGAVGLAGVLALWLPVMLIAALFSGWWELAQAHPRVTPEPGARRGAGSVYLSPLYRYKGIVQYTADDEHLHLSMPPIVGAFHNGMSLPWAKLDFFRGDRPVLGMIAAEIDGRRLLVSKHMVKHELAVRHAMSAMRDASPSVGRPPVAQVPPTDQLPRRLTGVRTEGTQTHGVEKDHP